MNLTPIIEQMQEAMDNLHRNRTVPPSREELHTLISNIAHAVHEAAVAEVVAWAKSNARTKGTAMSDFPENHEWNVDYHELVDFLTALTDQKITKEDK